VPKVPTETRETRLCTVRTSYELRGVQHWRSVRINAVALYAFSILHFVLVVDCPTRYHVSVLSRCYFFHSWPGCVMAMTM
jgi:hypothetical protein